jgi:tetratricopeptide (TPR) repeat protein
MRKHVAVVSVAILVMVLGALAGVRRAEAQSAVLTLPDLSQHARVLQRIGLTDITIDYHRPLVRGRKIFGGVQAYGEVWRAGANFNTTIDLSDPVTIEGQPLAKGIYGLHFIPGETSWIVIFSKNSTSWGSFTYNQAEDALRVTVKPQAIEHREVLSYEFDDPTPNATVLTMRWDTVAVPFRIEVNTREIVAQSLRNQLRSRVQTEWQAWEEAANYLLENKLSADEAATYADRSIQIEDRFENEITKARALSALGRQAEARAAQAKALTLGTESQVYQFGRGLQRLGQQNQALDIFRSNIEKHPNTVIAYTEAARIAAATGDYTAAIKQMRLAVDSALDGAKATLRDLVRQLENNVDINK